MERYFIGIQYKDKNNAGSKAPEDIEVILKNLNYKPIYISRYYKIKWLESLKFDKILNLFKSIINWLKIFFLVSKESVLVVQHPVIKQSPRIIFYSLKLIKSIKKCKTVAIVHDLESLRLGTTGIKMNNNRLQFRDHILLKEYNYVICHNNNMKNYLISCGFKKSQLIKLSLFDYLHLSIPEKRKSKNLPIIIAGNLLPTKSGYIYKLEDINKKIKFNLYGPNYDETKSFNFLNYCGQYSPEELPKHLSGSFGLVWDGDSIETCSGNTGNYLKYNSPHKLSLYLASGLPIIIWSQAAMASFVKEHCLGLVVDNLYQIEEKIQKLSDNKYNEMLNNVLRISGRFNEGFFIKNALEKINNKIKND